MADAWSLDRRRSERRDVPFPLHARLVGTGDAIEPSTARVSGLSVGGMVIDSPAPLSVDDRLSIVLSAPGGDIGPIAGRIVHSRMLLGARSQAEPTYVAGVAFEVPSAEAIAAIEALLFSLAGPPAPGDTERIP